MAIDTTKKVKKITVDGTEMSLGGGIEPTGTIKITTNGTHDVTNYASANVSVSADVLVPPTPTLLYITLSSPMTYTLYFSGTGGTIDWGDGTSFENLSSTITHNYQSGGNYIIKITGYRWRDIANKYIASSDAVTTFGTGTVMLRKNIFGETSTGELSQTLRKVVLGSDVYCKPYAFAHCPYLCVDLDLYGIPYLYLNRTIWGAVNNPIQNGCFYNSHTTVNNNIDHNELVISPNITKINASAFAGSSFTTLIIKPSQNEIISLGATNALPAGLTKIYVHNSELSAYQTATNWSNFASLMVAY